jgi:hypothetical protein
MFIDHYCSFDEKHIPNYIFSRIKKLSLRYAREKVLYKLLYYT